MYKFDGNETMLTFWVTYFLFWRKNSNVLLSLWSRQIWSKWLATKEKYYLQFGGRLCLTFLSIYFFLLTFTFCLSALFRNWRQKTERGVESRQRENENVVISFSVFPLFHFPLSLSLSLKCCFSLTRYNNYCFNSVLVFLSLKRAFRKDRLKLRDLIMILFTYPRPTT